MNIINKIDDDKCRLEFGATRTLGRFGENINQYLSKNESYTYHTT